MLDEQQLTNTNTLCLILAKERNSTTEDSVLRELNKMYQGFRLNINERNELIIFRSINNTL